MWELVWELVWASTSKSRLFSAGVGSWTVIVQDFRTKTKDEQFLVKVGEEK